MGWEHGKQAEWRRMAKRRPLRRVEKQRAQSVGGEGDFLHGGATWSGQLPLHAGGDRDCTNSRGFAQNQTRETLRRAQEGGWLEDGTSLL